MSQVAKEGQHAVPDGCAQECENGEGQNLHAGDACGNGNQLTDHGDETADKSGNDAVFTEIIFGFLNLLNVQKQEVAQAAVCEFVDNGTAQELCQIIVDECADHGADACEEHDQYDVQTGIGLESLIGCRGNYQFRRKRDERTFYGHEEGDCAVVQVGVVPVDNQVVNHGRQI